MSAEMVAGREIPVLEKCPRNVPGTHTWRYSAASICCRDCGIDFARKSLREMLRKS